MEKLIFMALICFHSGLSLFAMEGPEEPTQQLHYKPCLGIHEEPSHDYSPTRDYDEIGTKANLFKSHEEASSYAKDFTYQAYVLSSGQIFNHEGVNIGNTKASALNYTEYLKEKEKVMKEEEARAEVMKARANEKIIGLLRAALEISPDLSEADLISLFNQAKK